MQELLRTGIYFCKLEVNLPIHLGKKYGVLVMYFKCDMCYKIIKELETRDYRREGESNGAGISLYLMGNGPALDCRASGYWDIY